MTQGQEFELQAKKNLCQDGVGNNNHEASLMGISGHSSSSSNHHFLFAGPETIKIISWSCQDMDNLIAVPILKDLIRCHRSNIILLFETLVQVNKIDEIRIYVGFDYSFAVYRLGRDGGFAILWRNNYHCRVLNYTQNYINMEVEDPNKGKWRLTGFYGFPGRRRIRYSWHVISTLAAMSMLPWCIVGDFNDLLAS